MHRLVNAATAGYSRSTSQAVVFGAFWYGGLGWRHLYFEQGILHVLLLIKHLRTPGPFSSLLQICLDWYQLITGVSFSPWYMSSIPLLYTDSPWLDSTHTFLSHCFAQLVIPTISLPKLQRQHDACIMDGIFDLNLSATTMKRINSCRLWLRSLPSATLVL
jgi:hypothetical protein